VPLSTPVSDRRAPLAEFGERALVALIRRRFPADPALLPVGIGDDAAIATPMRGVLEVLTTDALVEGVHFDLAFSRLEDVGYKALAVNISDIAAMGARARLALLSLILPKRMTVGEIESLLDGVAALAADAGVTVAGGNVTESPGPLIVDAALLGAVRPRKFLTRSGGHPGDALYVTGFVGAAAAGLDWLRRNGGSTPPTPDDQDLAACVARYRRPEPRFRLGSALGRNRAAGACMDLSDGLADAVTAVATSSGTGAVIEAEKLPIPGAVRRLFESGGRDAVRMALSGGDDYELLFSVPEKYRSRLKTALQQSRGVRVTRIGELTASPAIVLKQNGETGPLPVGFTHF
jgi:thiamine-monophosphate kinase